MQIDGNLLILKEELKLIIFSGKGGRDRITCSCAAALHCAQRGQKTLLASTDPAHTLSDSLDMPIGRLPAPVPGTGKLYVMEMDPHQYLEQFIKDNGDILKAIAGRGTYLDLEDINDIFSLCLPCMDELMVILELMDQLECQAYDVLILDTASTGQTLRLLSLPNYMSEWLLLLDLKLEKYRFMASVFRRYRPDAVDAFIKRFYDKVSRLKKLLTDPALTQLIPVVIPEPGSIKETEKLIKAAQSQGIPLSQMIVNRAASDRECIFCRQRRADQINKLEEIKNKFEAYSRIELPLLPYEVRGVSALAAYAERMFNPDSPRMTDTAIPMQTCVTALVSACLAAGQELADKKYILIGGKEGGGKTSIAAATGLYIANQGKRTLVYSTDPNHSLSDRFAGIIGNQITPFPGSNYLYGLEIDSKRMSDEFKQQYVEEIYEIFDRYLCRNEIDMEFDREIMTWLIAPEPPCLDEVIALLKMMELTGEENYDVIILDIAPTEHLVRMLERPKIALRWFETLFRLLSKYEALISLDKTKELMKEMVRGVQKVQTTLMASDQMAFVGVIVPEATVFTETEKLLAAIRQSRINSRGLVVNLIMPTNQCSFCNQVQVQQQSYMEQLRTRFTGYQTVEIPLFPHPVSGSDNLEELACLLYGLHP